MKHPSDFGRRADVLLRSLGYELVRNGNHPIYGHAEQPNITISASPRNGRSAWKRLRADLVKRHPDAQQLASNKRSTKRARLKAQRLREADKHTAPAKTGAPRIDHNALGDALRFYRCDACGHPWTHTGWRAESACPRDRCRSTNIRIERVARAA